MIPVLTAEESRRADTQLTRDFGLPSLLWMENAARGALDVLLEHFPCDRPVLVGGIGQNGGDAWAVARLLAARDIASHCLLVGERDAVRGDAATQLRALMALGRWCTVEVVAELPQGVLAERLARASVIVDGLFGTGLDRPVQGLAAEAVHQINQAGRPVLALDLPSGIHADTGTVMGSAVRADRTATFGALKRGLQQAPGAVVAGEVTVHGLGAPLSDIGSAAQIESADVGRWIRPRPRDIHKGTAGHVWVVGGEAGKAGAACLAGRAALRAGAGRVTVAQPGGGDAHVQSGDSWELMRLQLPEPPSFEQLQAQAKSVDVAVLGPGLGLDPSRRAFAVEVAARFPRLTVVDADALTALGGNESQLAGLRRAPAPRVLTPHPKEAAVLLGVNVSDVQQNRCEAAQQLAEMTGATIVLKGAVTIVAEASKPLWFAGTPHPALAVAGSGDVLSGITAALLVDHTPRVAAAAAVVLHSMSGSIAACSDRGVLARELADKIPEALRKCWQIATREPRPGSPIPQP